MREEQAEVVAWRVALLRLLSNTGGTALLSFIIESDGGAFAANVRRVTV